MNDELKRKYESNETITVDDIVEYWFSYVTDLENCLGHVPTRGNLHDMMSDFGQFPSDWDYETIEKVIDMALDNYYGGK